MTPEQEAPPLLFAWEKRHRFRWRLFGLVLLSLAAHAVTFLLFQITYPPRVSIPPPAPEISLLLPTTPENRSLLQRIEAEDPALVAAASAIQPPGLAGVEYRASFEEVRTPPRTIAEDLTAVPFPPPKDPLEIIRSSTPLAQPATTAPPPQSTRLLFSPTLQARTPRGGEDWKWEPRAKLPLEPAVFLLGVAATGEVRFHFLQRSSGDNTLDEQVSQHVPTLSFAADSAPISWGLVKVLWGDDAYVQAP